MSKDVFLIVILNYVVDTLMKALLSSGGRTLSSMGSSMSSSTNALADGSTASSSAVLND